MMRFRQRSRTMLCLLVAAVSCAVAGCRAFDERPIVQGHSPLHPAQLSPDSVAIEMMWVRFPADDPLLNDDAWQNIDETTIAPEVRRELAANGFRAGIIKGNLPEAMGRALAAHDASGASVTSGDGASADSNSSVDLVNEPVVRGHRKQLHRNERWEVQASDVYPSMPLLKTSGRELVGQTYTDAQAIYALRVDPQPDRTVLMEVTPELHHGQPKLRFTGGDEGILRSQPLRDREVFDRMRMSVRLAPGELLVLMNVPNAGSRLGEYFHAVQSSQGRQQKLILVRLAQLPPSDTFAGE